MSQSGPRDHLVLLSLALAGACADFRTSGVDLERVDVLVAYVKRLEVTQAAGTMAKVDVMVRTARSMPEDAPHFLDQARDLVEEMLRAS